MASLRGDVLNPNFVSFEGSQQLIDETTFQSEKYIYNLLICDINFTHV